MKTLLNKIISLAAAAVILVAGFAVLPKPIPKPDGPTIPPISTGTDCGEGENSSEGDPAEPQIDDDDVYIMQ